MSGDTDVTMADAGAAVENTAPDLPQTAAQDVPDQTPGQTDERRAEGDADKSLKRMQRRVDRVTAERYKAQARADQLEAELARYKQPEPAQDDQPDIDTLVTRRAEEMRRNEAIRDTSTKIRDGIIKAAGSEAACYSLIGTVEEEAGALADSRGYWTPLGEAITESDDPAALLVYLGRNPEAAEALKGLTGGRLHRAIIKAETAMREQATRPPTPIKPVTSAAAPVRDPAKMSDADWYASRHKR